MSSRDEERVLWVVGDAACVMVSCCAGAELQIRRTHDIVLRELYPMKSDLYERARELEASYALSRSREANEGHEGPS